MSLVFTEPTNLGDLLKYEAPNLYSRDTVTIAAPENLPLGAVLGKVTATGKFKALNPAATDGTEVAAGVLIQACDATSGERRGGLLARHALVHDESLVFPAGISLQHKTDALNQLKAIGIVPRQGV
jgi:head decoration protein D